MQLQFVCMSALSVQVLGFGAQGLPSSSEVSAPIVLLLRSQRERESFAVESEKLWRVWTPRWRRRARRARVPAPGRAPVPSPSVRSVSRSRSGMLWRSGLGILWWTIARFAGTISWTCVSSVRRTKRVQRARNAQWHGVFATTPFISIASADG